MIQANALYGTGVKTEPEAIGAAIDMYHGDLSGIEHTTFQVTTSGSPGGYSVEITFFLEEGEEPEFEAAEDYEILG